MSGSCYREQIIAELGTFLASLPEQPPAGEDLRDTLSQAVEDAWREHQEDDPPPTIITGVIPDRDKNLIQVCACLGGADLLLPFRLQELEPN